MIPLFRAADVAEWTGGRIRAGDPQAAFTGVTVDSRRTRPGELFFALRGQRADGHAFVADAAARGAAGAVVERPPAADGELPDGFTLIEVQDAEAALGQVAAGHRRRLPSAAVAVTGSVGKTTTKEMVASVLAVRWPVFKSPGNYNNQVGLPLAVLAWRRDHAAGVFELAMRGPGQIAALCRILRPQVGVVTNVGESHLELLGSLEAVADAKAELVEALPPDGTAVLNADDPRVRAMASRTAARVVLYGLDGSAEVRAENAAADGPLGIRFTLCTPRGRRPVRLPVPGLHQVHNALAAAAVGVVFGLEPDEIAAGLAAFRPEEGRLNLRSFGAVTVLDDTYNAAPASTLAALRVLRQVARGRAVAVLADMLELGPAEHEGHRRVGREAARAADLLLGVGPRMAAAVAAAREAGMAPETARHYPDRDALLADLPDLVRPGDTVLVKGSRAMGMEAVVRALAAAFGGEPPAGDGGRGA